MGLDIVAYADAVPLDDPEHECSDDCSEHHIKAYVLEGFEQSLRGLVAGTTYDVAGSDTIRFRAGSYSGYNAFRDNLSLAVHGVKASAVYNDPDTYRWRPFYELIAFADNEGTIGTDAAADLADDFELSARQVLGVLVEHDTETYENFHAAFRLARKGGLVEFR